MYTALISPQYADCIETKARRKGGFVARGLLTRHPARPDSPHCLYALLPGQAPEDPHVLPCPADAVITALEAERQRYRVMARKHPDTLWQDAIQALDEMLERVHHQRLADQPRTVAKTA